MIRAYEAVTREIDDVEQAVSEILEQLAPMRAGAAGKNAVGILSCYVEYVDSGVVAALCERLPFDIVGTTTIANGTRGEIGDTMLTLLVLTSDDVSFATALSEPLDQTAETETEAEASIRACYEAALQKLGDKPVFMMSFFPLLSNVSTDYYIECMNGISGNLPNFGPISVDHNPDYHDSMVIRNGAGCRDRLAVLLFSGNVSPSFYVGNISDHSIFPEKGVVTAASGNLLISVNDMPMVDYFQSIGLQKTEDGSIAGINSLSLIVDYRDGTKPVVRATFALTPEGYAVCGAKIPVGAILSIGTFDAEEIVSTTGLTLTAALEEKKHSVIMIYSCVGRFFAQGLEQTLEMSRIDQCVKGTGVLGFAAYAGGEICPVYSEDGSAVNRFHNGSLIICAF